MEQDVLVYFEVSTDRLGIIDLVFYVYRQLFIFNVYLKAPKEFVKEIFERGTGHRGSMKF